MKVLQVENISKTYGDLKAVQDVSFQVEQGHIYGILGPNGSCENDNNSYPLYNYAHVDCCPYLPHRNSNVWKTSCVT